MCRVAIGYLYIHGCILLIEGNHVFINGEQFRHSAITFNQDREQHYIFPVILSAPNPTISMCKPNFKMFPLPVLYHSAFHFIHLLSKYSSTIQRCTLRNTQVKNQRTKNKINHQNHRHSQALVCGIQKKA